MIRDADILVFLVLCVPVSTVPFSLLHIYHDVTLDNVMDIGVFPCIYDWDVPHSCMIGMFPIHRKCPWLFPSGHPIYIV